MKHKSETEIMEELLESIYSGNLGEDDSKEKDESEESDTDIEETEEKDESTESDDESSDDESDDDESSDDESSDDESDDESDEESDEDNSDDESPFGSDDDDLSPKAGGAFKSQVKSLKKQYNDLLVDSFEKYSTECIEDALDEVDSAFGENIEDILNLAMDKLKGKIMGDLGVESSTDMEGMPPAAMAGGFDPTIASKIPMEIEIAKS